MRSAQAPAARLLRFGGAVAFAGSGIGLLGLFRIGQLFPGAAASPGLLIPFLWPVLALALEASTLVAVSTATGSLAGAGTRHSLATRVRSLAPVILAMAALLALAELVPRGSERPGVFANQLVRRALEGCGSSRARSVSVPLIGLQVRCDGRAPRIEGPMPGAPFVRVSMAAVTFSEDLRRVHVVGLELSSKRSLPVHVRAGRATISGLAPWARAESLRPASRFGVVLGTGLGIALFALLLSRAPRGNRSAPGEASRISWARRGLDLVIRALPGVAAASTLIALDQERASATAYILPLLAALTTLGVGAALSASRTKVFKGSGFGAGSGGF